MGGGRRRSGTTAIVALLASALVVVPAASALGEHDETVAQPGAAAALTAHAERTGKHEHDPSDFPNSIVAAGHAAAEAAGGALPQQPVLPTGFADQKVITGMSEAVSADFAPNGTAFIALKTGQIKVAEYAAGTDSWGTATDFADLQTQVNNYGDRGLTGIAVDPQFPTRPYVYVNYTYDKDPRDGVGGVVPKWGRGTAYDVCQTPADENDETVTGCIVQDRVTRLTASRASGAWRMTAEKELLAGGCYQFSSHASGDVAFGPDGKLYASAGDGASFNTLDFGQYANACGDPTNEGGSLRSQDYRSTGDPLGVDGSVFRVDPDTSTNPNQGNASQWLVAYGQRNPWRLTFRPEADGSGTSNELWSVDVGASKAEEVNKVADVTAVPTPVNRGWPCYEGDYLQSAVQPGWDALDKPLCENLYTQGLGAVQKPVFSYQTRDGGPLVPGEDCANETSSVSGVAFPPASSDYPAAYRNAMFFSDFARSCIWVLAKKSDGEPDPTTIRTFVQAAATPADLLIGPGGDLYYVDYGLTPDGGVGQGTAGVHRIVYTGSNGTPTARITADKLSGPAPLTVNFSGATSTDPDGDALTYDWDLDGDGTFETLGNRTPSRQYAVGTYTVTLRVDDGHGHTHTATAQVQAGNTAPSLTSVTPVPSLTWATGDTISYSAAATDAQPGALTYTWQVEIRHCPSGVCHTHPFGSYTGASGTFTAPPHEYPSKLGVSVLVTDAGGLTDTRSMQLEPKTVAVTFASSPTGAGVTVGETAHTAPYTETFIQKSPATVTAAPLTGSGATVAAFSSWSDAGARSHTVNPGTAPSTLTATYTRPTAGLTASPTSGSAPLPVGYTASGTNAPGVTGGFTYAWDLDGDGAYDDGSGATTSATYATAGDRTVRVLVTDSRGATDDEAVTVSVGAANRSPVAQASANPAAGPAPLATTLSAAGSSDPDGDPLSYAWDTDADGAFDDGTAQSVSATYSGVGPHVATVRVSDGRGGSATKTVTVTVTNRGPTARITSDPATLEGTAPFAVTFSGATSSDPDGHALAYAWDLDGDGQYDDGTGGTASRTYGVGTVAVRLRVTDTAGASSTAQVTVTVGNRAPVASIITDPHTATGPAPLVVAFDGSGSADPDGTALSYAWDLDGDGSYDDATGVTASATYAVGTVTVGLRVTDTGGLSGTTTRAVTASNSAPVVTRLTSYPAGGYAVGQTLGFDAEAVDGQDGALPDAAYSFVVLRQACDSGCPRVEVQRWTGVQNAQYVVPALPYPSHLYLVVTATDAQGATGTRELRLDPTPVALTVTGAKGVQVQVDGAKAKKWRGTLVAGSTVRVVAPKRHTENGVRYVFLRWSDGGGRRHDVTVWDATVRLKAVYRRVR